MDTAQLLAKHLERFGKGDLDGILSEYTEDSVLLSTAGVFRGPDQLRPIFAAAFAEFGQPGVEFEMLAHHAEGDVAYIAWKAETPQNSYAIGTDTMVIRDGKIVTHTTAVAATAKS